MSTPSDLTGLAERMLRPGTPWSMRSLPGRRAKRKPWPEWCNFEIVSALSTPPAGKLYRHQAEVLELLHAGVDTVISTGTASGKTLCYTAALAQKLADEPGATALLIFPTKALAADQLHRLTELRLPWLRPAAYDGDTGYEARRWARRNANVLLTNVDMLHASLLPGHDRFSVFMRGLRSVVVDEAHVLRGVFGSHASMVLRRLCRVASSYGSRPVFTFTSATLANAGEHCARLIGRPVQAIIRDDSPSGERHFLFIMPSETYVEDTSTTEDTGAMADAGIGAETGLETDTGVETDTDDVRRATPSMLSVTAHSVAEAVIAGHPTLNFCRTRKAAELAAAATSRELIDGGRRDLATRVQAYRGGYLPEDRRAIERSLRRGELIAVSSTNALESGIDIGGLDVVVMNGFPGSASSFFQQSGRAGRGSADSLTVLIAGYDALDRFYAEHPDSLLAGGSEEALIDPDNPFIREPHLRLASAERPLDARDTEYFSANVLEAAADLAHKGLLRHEDGRYYPSAEDYLTSSSVDIRGSAGPGYSVVDAESGAILGTADAGQAMYYLHPGAVYMHRGAELLIEELDIEARVAVATEFRGDYYTRVREESEIEILSIDSETSMPAEGGPIGVTVGSVRATSRFPSFQRLRSRGGGEVLSTQMLDLPSRSLVTEAVWLTFTDDHLGSEQVAQDIPGSLHALEHMLIGLLPLHALCDRRDIGGLSTILHTDTLRPTIFIHEGAPGGSGLARRAAAVMPTLFAEVASLVSRCACASGCPACIQSPKCGNHNEPLSKPGALAMARLPMAGSPLVEGRPGGRSSKKSGKQ